MSGHPLHGGAGGGVGHAHGSDQGDLSDPLAAAAVGSLHHGTGLQSTLGMFITDPDPGLLSGSNKRARAFIDQLHQWPQLLNRLKFRLGQQAR